MAAALETAMHDIKECLQCHSFSDDEICPICLDHRRDDGLLCVVENASDVMAIEQSGAYRGKYFVLGGHLSPIDGINANDLHIDQLIHRIRHEAIHEVILATGATVEGQTTAFLFMMPSVPMYPKLPVLLRAFLWAVNLDMWTASHYIKHYKIAVIYRSNI